MKQHYSALLAATLILTLAVGGVAAVGGLASTTQTIGVTSNTSTGPTAALGATTARAHSGMNPVYVGGSHVSRVGAATSLRLATQKNKQNITVVGTHPGIEASYFSGVKNPQGSYVYRVQSLQSKTLDGLSQSIATHEYASASAVTLANPRRQRDVIGGTANATRGNQPLLYSSSSKGWQALNATLGQLGTRTVYLTSNVPSKTVSNLTSAGYVTANLSTDTTKSFVNTQGAATTGSHLYIAGNLSLVPSVEGGSHGQPVMLANNSAHPGSSINSYLSTHGTANVTVVADPSQFSASAMNAIEQNTTGHVRRVGYASTPEVSSRLALLHANAKAPLVYTTATIGQVNGNTTVRVRVRNIGFNPAKHVTLSLPKQGGTYQYTQTQPAATSGNQTVWKLSSLQANGTATIQYQVTGVNASFAYTPSVVSYQNTVGTSFQGASFFGQLASWASPLTHYFGGLLGSVQGFVSHPVQSVTHLSWIAYAAILGIVVLFGAGVWYTISRGKQLSIGGIQL